MFDPCGTRKRSGISTADASTAVSVGIFDSTFDASDGKSVALMIDGTVFALSAAPTTAPLCIAVGSSPNASSSSGPTGIDFPVLRGTAGKSTASSSSSGTIELGLTEIDGCDCEEFHERSPGFGGTIDDEATAPPGGGSGAGGGTAALACVIVRVRMRGAGIGAADGGAGSPRTAGIA